MFHEKLWGTLLEVESLKNSFENDKWEMSTHVDVHIYEKGKSHQTPLDIKKQKFFQEDTPILN